MAKNSPKKCNSRLLNFSRNAPSKLAQFRWKTAELVKLTGGEGEASILDKLQDYPKHVLIWERSQQLAGEAAVPVRSIMPDCPGILLSFKRVLSVLRKQNGLVYG